MSRVTPGRNLIRETLPLEVRVNQISTAPSESVAEHEAAGDPHSQYLTAAEGAAAFDAVGTATAAIASHVGDYHDAPTAPAGVTLSGSPHTYTNGSVRPVQIITTGGTVTLIEISHNGSAWIDVGFIVGVVTLARGYRYRVTYAVAPTVTAVEF